VRLAWSPPRSRYTIWAAASKAIRQPARVDTAIQTDVEAVPVSPDTIQVLRYFGNPRIKAEELRDYELGYRTELTRALSLDIATFLSLYRHLNTVEPQPLVVIPGPIVQLEIPLLSDNKAYGTTYGGEASLNWNANSRWRISPGFSYLHATLRQDQSSTGLVAFTLATAFPQTVFHIRSSVNLSRMIEFDQSLNYTARLPGGDIPGHARLDLRLARHFGESAEISLVGQNLLRPRSAEYGDSYAIIGTQSLRSIYAQITWKF
jgi:iron complex outermembrane recepter protein